MNSPKTKNGSPNAMPDVTRKEVIELLAGSSIKHPLDLTNADLSGLDLSGLDLSFAQLNGANLRNTNLKEADLGFAKLNGADLTGANLSKACLVGAKLNGANLTGANLYYANLCDSEGENVKTSFLPAITVLMTQNKITYTGCGCSIFFVALLVYWLFF